MNVLSDIALPVLLLAAVGALAPYGWARLLPEGVGMLFVNVGLSAATAAAVAGLWRFGLAAPGWGPLLRWEALSAIVWGPVVILAVAQQPRRWTTRQW